MRKTNYPLPRGVSFNFPQDPLINPETNGRNIDAVSAIFDDRESFCFVWNIPLLTNAGGMFLVNFPIPQNYNFWLSNLSTAQFFPSVGTGNFNVPGHLTVADGEQNYVFIRGAASAFSATTRSNRSTWPIPYLIRAGQSFRASLIVDVMTAYTSANVQFSFEGWKDYSYA